MVAFAGRKYAARSIPAFIANSTFIVTSFTLVKPFLYIISYTCYVYRFIKRSYLWCCYVF